jgi:biotin carboxylase
MSRVLLLMPVTTYRANDFLEAAQRLDLDVVVGSNQQSVLARFDGGRSLALDFGAAADAVAKIVEHAQTEPFAAIVGTDDDTIIVAAAASKALSLPCNQQASVEAARDKHLTRTALTRAGVKSPWFSLVSLEGDPSDAALAAEYPCVLKPLNLSASRGVIRADNPAAFMAACARITAIIETTGGDRQVLVEGFVPGPEVALEGMLDDGHLSVLALFDKPDPMDGPHFEETLYVTPSRLPDRVQRQVTRETAAAAQALGLRHGPIHAELRVNDAGAWIIEVAARSIGGLCSRSLAFSHGLSLEDLILRHATGQPIGNLSREDRAAGVMMIPVPAPGRFDQVDGIDAARKVPGIEEVIISISLGETLVPVPEGDRYLGFIFARAATPAEVEAALRHAHACLEFDVSASPD